LFLGNLSWSSTQDSVREVFSVYGPIRRVSIGAPTHLHLYRLPSTNTFPQGKNAEGGHRGYAHVEFESEKDAIRAHEAHDESPITIDDREIRMDFGAPSSNRGSPTQRRGIKERREPSPTIYVGNVPLNATRDDIHEALKSLGDMAAIRIGGLP